MTTGETHPWRRWLCAAAILALAATSANAEEAARFPEQRSPQMRVATIGYRLASVNQARCSRVEPLTGLMLHDLASYEPKDRREIAMRYGLDGGVGVLGVVPASVAAEAGLRSGDEIQALNSMPVGQLPIPSAGASASYDRIAAFTDLLVSGLSRGSVSLTVKRDGRSLALTMPRRDGCAARVALLPGSKPDAWSDGRYAAVTQALAEAAGDDELAFALGHEMAHVVLGHAAEAHGALTGIGIGGKRSREREREADRLGIIMSLSAGYSEAGAERLLTRLAQANAPGLSLTHPSIRARLSAIHETVSALSPASP